MKLVSITAVLDVDIAVTLSQDSESDSGKCWVTVSGLQEGISLENWDALDTLVNSLFEKMGT
ncbi:MAG: hypothetical protein ACOCUT_04395 [bacterium]